MRKGIDRCLGATKRGKRGYGSKQHTTTLTPFPSCKGFGFGYATPTIYGIPNASRPGTKSELAHKCARWLRNTCHLGFPQRFRAGDEVRSGPQPCLCNPCRRGGAQLFRAGDGSKSGP